MLVYYLSDYEFPSLKVSLLSLTSVFASHGTDLTNFKRE